MANKLFSTFYDFILPKNCIYCNLKGCNICTDCVKRKLIKVCHRCHICRQKVSKKGIFVHSDCKKFTNLDGIFSCFQYNQEAKKILHLIKYQGYYDLLKDIALSMDEYFSVLPFGYDFLVPVPIHKSRRISRGFNQAELLAKALTWNFRSILTRTRSTKPQAELNKEERAVNVKDVFKLSDKSVVVNKKILLIDDVYTTGATLENCAKELKIAGSGSVFALTWARD